MFATQLLWSLPVWLWHSFSAQRTSVTTWTLAHVRAMENLGWSLLSYTWLFLLGELMLVSVSQEGTNRK